jgi:hypothetical protein
MHAMMKIIARRRVVLANSLRRSVSRLLGEQELIGDY